MRLGAHVSVAGGLSRSILNAIELGCKTIQIFGASPQQWAVRRHTEKEIGEFKGEKLKSPVETVYLHAAYLANLGSADQLIWARSVKNISEHLKIAEAISAEGLIFHVGSGKGLLPEEAIAKVGKGMREIFEAVPGKTCLFLENGAGGGDKMGSTAAQIAEILRQVNNHRAKVCFDTAHAFEAGIIENYRPESVKKLLDEWDKIVGLENIPVFHINDSKTAYNSHHDRHENLGEGFIGLSGFKNLLSDKRVRDRDWILEVPGFEGLGPDRKNMELLRSCT